MAKERLTVKRISTFGCPVGKAQAFLWDASQPGLGIRATPNGKPAFVFQGVYQGKTVRVTIGSPDAWTIPQAQERARTLQREIDAGRDPRDLKRGEVSSKKAEVARAQAEKDRAVLVGDVWPIYLREGKPKRRDSWKPRYRADMQAMASPGGERKKRGKGNTRPGPLYPLMAVRLVDLNEDSLKVWYDTESLAGKHQAARAFMVFRGFLRWCATRPEFRGLVDRNLRQAQAIVDALPQVKSREDCLEVDQIGPWWQAVEKLTNQTASAYLRALLLTGARREEMAALKWVDVDMRWRRLRLADKYEESRVIPLGRYLRGLLAQLPRHGPFVFASASRSGHIADARSNQARALQAAGIAGITLHGLRRTFALRGEGAGAPAGAIAQIMGHKPSATAEGYKPRSLDALRPFLEQIEQHILGLAGVDIDSLPPTT